MGLALPFMVQTKGPQLAFHSLNPWAWLCLSQFRPRGPCSPFQVSEQWAEACKKYLLAVTLAVHLCAVPLGQWPPYWRCIVDVDLHHQTKSIAQCSLGGCSPSCNATRQRVIHIRQECSPWRLASQQNVEALKCSEDSHLR